MKRNYAKRTADEFNFIRSCFQKFWMYFVAVPIFWLFYKFEITGRENIPKDKRFICAANHISYFDPFLVSVAVKKPVAYMAKEELFEGNRFFVFCMDYLTRSIQDQNKNPKQQSYNTAVKEINGGFKK